MELFEELTEENFLIYAARHYHSPRCINAEEFYEDLHRFKYIKRLVNRYNRGGDLAERLVLNHITILLNVFGHEPFLNMLEFKIGVKDFTIIKPFLVFKQAIREDQYTNISMDEVVVEKLRNI
jgi:hypothetical protein